MFSAKLLNSISLLDLKKSGFKTLGDLENQTITIYLNSDAMLTKSLHPSLNIIFLPMLENFSTFNSVVVVNKYMGIAIFLTMGHLSRCFLLKHMTLATVFSQ